MEPLPCATFEDAFNALAQGEADLAMIPIENTIAGRVADIHHLLPESQLHIVGEYFMPIHFQLMVLPGVDRSDIKSVHSHVHALGQCRKVVRANGWKAVVAGDTAGAARLVSKSGDRTMAALAPRLAAELYGLDILAENVEDTETNVTRFVVLSRTRPKSRRARWRTRWCHHLRLPGPQHSRRALQGDGRFRHQRRQHDQAGKLSDRRQVLRHPVLRRHPGPSRRTAGGARHGRARLLLQGTADPGRLSGTSVPLGAERRASPKSTEG
jgi:hypothetical protein